MSLGGLTLQALASPVPLDITLGLFLGNQISVLGFSRLTIRLGFARLHGDVSWLSL